MGPIVGTEKCMVADPNPVLRGLSSSPPPPLGLRFLTQTAAALRRARCARFSVLAEGQQKALGARRPPVRVLPLNSVPSPSLFTSEGDRNQAAPTGKGEASPSPHPVPASGAAASGLALACGRSLVPFVAR
jgi:hypothetical protein